MLRVLGRKLQYTTPQLRRKDRPVTVGKSTVKDSPSSHDVKEKKRSSHSHSTSVRSRLRSKSKTAERKSCRCFRGALSRLSSLCDVRGLSLFFHGLNVLLDGCTDAFVWC